MPSVNNELQSVSDHSDDMAGKISVTARRGSTVVQRAAQLFANAGPGRKKKYRVWLAANIYEAKHEGASAEPSNTSDSINRQRIIKLRRDA